MIDSVTLITGSDIPFPEIGITIHQPTIEEIGVIGEKNFFIGVNFLNFKRNSLDDNILEQLKDFSDFEIMISIINNKEVTSRLYKNCVELVLTIMFPEYHVEILPDSICFIENESLDSENPITYFLNKENYDKFKKIVYEIYALSEITGHEQDYDPANPLAKQIVNKIKRGRERLKELKSQEKDGQDSSIFSKYLSILAVGEQKDINILKKYTVYQLFDEFQRFVLKENFDMNIRARMAGATDLDEAEDWMKDLHTSSDDNIVM